MNKIVIIDGYSLLFRGYYATFQLDKERLMRSNDGTPTNAIYAFCNMLASIMKNIDKDNDAIFVALDSSKHTFRHQQYKEYKANRKPLDEELKVQFPILREMLASLNIKFYENENLEADDIAGNIAKKMEKENYKVEIYTSDKDYLQLIDDNISINLIKKGLKDIKVMTPTTFKEEWGFDPIQIIDYKALRGDDSDNLKGIPGIGDKTAKDLIIKYNNFEDIVKNADTSKKVGQNIVEFQENGRMCLALATIKTDDDLPILKDDVIYKGYDFNILNSFMNKYNFKTLINKFPTSLRKISEDKHIEFKEIKDTSSITFNDKLGIAIDIENNNYHYAKLYGISFTVNEETYYINYENLLKNQKLLDILKDENIKKYAFDYKKIMCVFSFNKLEINGLYFDLLLASYLLEPSLSSSLNDCLSYFNKDISYALNDDVSLFTSDSNALLTSISSYYSLNLENKVIEELKEKNQLDLLYKIEQPLTLVLGNMEIDGFPLNKKSLEEFGKYYSSKCEELKKAIYQINDNEEFNINSPKQLAEVLFDKLGLWSDKKRSTSADNLIKIASFHPIVPLILEYRKYAKMSSTYIDGLIPYIDEKGLIHCNFNQALTQTGRLSSSEPNLQNISIRDEESKLIRKAFFYNDPSLNILSLDYSQIELRLLAHMSHSKTMTKVFNENEDIHAETARKIFHLDREPTSEERRKAKTVNFGIVYGISDWGLAEQLHIGVKEAKEIIDSFYNEFPEIKAFLNSLIAQANLKGYTSTIFNRHRYLKNINSSDYQTREFEKRAAMNAPIQGSAADLIKIAMIEVDKELRKRNLKARIVNQIHDEIILKVNDEEKDEVYQLVKNIMENCVELDVKLLVEGSFAKNWYEAK